MPDPDPNPNPNPTAPTPSPTPAPNPAPADPAKPADPAVPPVDPAKPVDPNAPKEPAKDPKADENVPLTAESVKLPEGFEADKPLLDKFVGVMNDPALTPATRAQALVDLQAEAMKGASERASQLWAEKQTQWQDEVKADPTVGGAKLDGVLAGISTLLNTHGTPEVRQAFDETGAGNNVHIVKFLATVASLIGEGKAAPASQPASPPQGLADRMFPNHK